MNSKSTGKDMRLLLDRVALAEQWVVADSQTQPTDLLQPTPTARGQLLASSNLLRGHQLLIKRTFDDDRFEFRIDNELCEHGVAPQVPLGSSHQVSGLHLADDVPQIEIAVGDVFNFITADFAHVTLIAFRHVVTAVVCEGRIDASALFDLNLRVAGVGAAFGETPGFPSQSLSPTPATLLEF
ncbi:MAG: hypothetical protein JWP89_4089 [Schlesneria sp.]|nr:hypothetical protein [Schlesneria sp.]